ncbi:MAG: amino acid adenylation domain-containing protein, partial [Bacillota bacterium]|nr:amino acid adenylation domain-containing protein [Bacillota bacterium]
SYAEVNNDTKKEDIAFIMFSSGSTGIPKGVTLTHENVIVQICATYNSFRLNSKDTFLSWMPLTHTVALSKFHIVPTAFSLNQYIMTKTLFINNSLIWLQKASEHKATILASPNFGYKHFLSQFTDELKLKWNLEHVKIIQNSAEPISKSLAEEFLFKLDKYKLSRKSMCPEYGMTETCMSISCTPVDEEYKWYVLDRKYMSVGDAVKELEGEDPKGITFVSVGNILDSCNVRICNDNDEMLKEGTIGHIQLVGKCLMLGYYNDNESNANCHTKDGWFKTGDVGFIKDNKLVVTGRAKDMIISNGLNFYAHDIERVAQEVEGVNLSAVCSIFDDSMQKEESMLFILYEGRLNDFISLESRIRRQINTKTGLDLKFIIPISEIPRTQSGKIQRYKLREMYLNGEFSQVVCELHSLIKNNVNYDEYVAPRNSMEEKLVEIWTQILGKDKLGIDDNFFELGGHSLKVIQLVSIIHKEMNIDVRISEIFNSPTIRQLGQYIEQSEESVYSSIEPVREREIYNASSAQKRLFALCQFNKNEMHYNIPYVMDIEGKIEKEKVEEAFQKLVNRHEALRTSFELQDGEIFQRIHKYIKLDLEYVELSKAENHSITEVIETFMQSFDLSKAPLFRVKLVKIREEKHVLMFDIHHIIADGTSVSIIMKEFGELYNGKELEEIRIQYKEYSVWQNKLLNSEIIKKQEEYWLGVYKEEIPVLDMPTDYQRPAIQSFEGESIGFKIDKELTEKLKKVGNTNGSTLYMTLLSIYNILLHKYSGQDDIIVGSPIAGRPHTQLQGIMGMFVNTLAIRNYPKRENTFKEFLQDVKKNALNAYENQDYQFEELVEKLNLRRDLSRNALFDTMFVLQNTDAKEIQINNLKFKQYEFANKISKFDITLSLTEVSDGIDFNVEYCTRLFNRNTIERFLRHFENIAKDVADNPEKKISEIDMLSEEEKKKILVDFNDTKAWYPKDKTIHELFEEQVEKTPENIVVVYEEQELSYRELNRRANQLARVLREKGVGSDKIVGIMAERSLEMIVGIMGILKAGGAYLPIDSEYPKERIEYMLEDSKADILLAQAHLLGNNNSEFSREIIEIDKEELYVGDTSNLDKINEPSDLAYVIYTSGTTGKPKGVMIEHRSMINTILWRKSEYGLTHEDNVLQIFSFYFDGFITSFFVPIVSGSKVILLAEQEAKDPVAMVKKIKNKNITHFISVPALFTAMLEVLEDKNVKSLRMVTLAGENITHKIVEQSKKLLPKAEIINEYGPTENTIATTIMRDVRVEKHISIGKPISNTRVYILDKSNKLQPIGVSGELCISGDGLARGYLDRRELTEEKFIPNPYEPGERMYKTGDLARWLPDGNIEFIERIDHQVKIRGFRIELGEIESQLLKHEEIREVVVIDKEDKEGNKYLCAYVVGDKELTVTELREHLSKELPDYMVPLYFIQLENIPLTPNGKIDRKGLPEPDSEINTGVEYAAPRNEVEEKIAKVWSEVLGVETIGIDDNFFALGGHSLKAIQVVSMIHRELNVELSVSKLFNSPTIRQIGESIKNSKESIYTSIEPVEKKEVYEVSSAQRRLYALNQFAKEEVNYNIPSVMIVEGKLGRAKVEKVFKKLVERHESFRTSFEMIDGDIVQKIHKEIVLDVEYSEVEDKKEVL